MKALTLRQPWATLLAYGEKQLETRSWRTHYRGPVAIHASARMTAEECALCLEQPFSSALRHCGITGLGLCNPRVALPLGQIIGVARLTGCDRTEVMSRLVSPVERAFGNYDEGRWAWNLSLSMVLPDPIPWKGRLGLWDLPDETLPAQVRALLA